MTSTARDGDETRSLDPFVRQVTWLVNALGGRDQLARASENRVSARTLDNWSNGRYPRNAVTGAVRDLDAWAMEHVEGYPEGAGVPRLVETCGRSQPEPARTGDVPAPEVPEPDLDEPARRRRRRLAWALAAAVVAVAAVVGTFVLQRPDDGAAITVPLPSTGDGTLLAETTGSIGANTFADPRTLQDNAQGIPPNTTVQVRCRYYAPSLPSVTPDGFWYLIDSGQWAGRWSPANSFMNGDVPGAPTLHNTDFAVPVCR
jgi:hypothetical protein